MMMGGDGASGGGNTNQFIGSKISLISKSEIRYEGILYSLDLEEATISLQKVRSFGTEDRMTSRPVGPKDEVYEFIIFRGADIKGIDVLEPPPQGKEEESEPVDPAIVEVQHYQPQAPQQVPSAQNAAVGGSGVALDTRAFGGNGFGGPPVLTQQPTHPIPTGAPIHQGFSLGVGFGNGVQEQSRGGAAAAAVTGPPAPGGNVGVSQSHGLVSPRDGAQSHDAKSPSSPENRGGNQSRRSYAPRGRGGSNDSQRGGIQTQPQQQQTQHHQGQRGGYSQARGAQASNRGGGGGGYYQSRGYVNGDARGQGQRKFYRRGELKGNKKITFDGEFDFEKANEELQKALMKIKIADGAEGEDEEEEEVTQSNVAEEVDKENERKEFYQKDNFFDNISCEALERKQGKRERPDWRAERKLNAETFGLPMKPGGSRGGGSSSTYYRGGGYHSHNNYGYNNYGGRGGYGGYGGSRGGQYRGYRGGGRGYGRGSRGGNNNPERNIERANAGAPKE